MFESWASPPEEAVKSESASPEVASELESRIYYPELIANEPLPNTSVAFSVPVRGEWYNGNLTRFLRSVFAQRLDDQQAFEVELILNSGRLVESLQARDQATRELMADEQGNAVIDEQTNPDRAEELSALLAESDQALAFLKKIVEVQRLARTNESLGVSAEVAAKLETAIEEQEDLLQRQILKLAAEKAEAISLAVVDLARKSLSDTPYNGTNLSSLRTLGADIVRTRFDSNPDLVMHMFDADTVLATNDAVKQTQALFRQHPQLQYLFAGMINSPAGTEQSFVADAPRVNVGRTVGYNSYNAHGSPQIAFRMRAYEKLKELAGWVDSGFLGDEDYDTSMRLIYHFGQLQDGLLFESSLDLQPMVMTGDRLDGSVDSVGRKMEFEAEGVRHITKDIGRVYEFQDKIEQYILALPVEQQNEIRLDLENARQHFKQELQIQQRFNRWLMRSYAAAVEQHYLAYENGELICNDAEILKMRGGEALLHYIKANPRLVGENLADPAVVAYIRNYLDDHGEEINQHDAPPFCQAIGEYIGEVKLFQELLDLGLLTKPEPEIQLLYGDYEVKTWHPEDKRTGDERISFMHTMVAETLALSRVYKQYFELKEHERTKSDLDNWPDNPDEQELRMHFGDSEQRWQSLQQWMDTKGAEIPQMSDDHTDQVNAYIDWRSVPISKLFSRLRARISR
jgi:hypothetical protein